MNINDLTQVSTSFSGSDNVSKSDNAASVQIAKEGNSQNVIFDTTKDCNVQKDRERSIVYGKNLEDARAQQNNQGVFGNDSENAFGQWSEEFLSATDVKDLEQEETPLEQYTSSSLDRAISRVKKSRVERQQNVDRQVEKSGENREHFETISEEGKVKEQLSNNLEMSQTPEMAALLTSDVPVNLINAMDSLSLGGEKQLIENNATLTPKTIYQASYISGTSAKGKESSNQNAPADNGFDEVKDQVEHILSDNGMAVNEETMAVAKNLYDNNIPVTADNIQTSMALDELKNLDTDTLLVRIADLIVDGVMPEEADLTIPSRVEAADMVDALTNTSDAQLKNTFTSEGDYIKAKRQLEEIRLKMTIDAARTMSAKGIELDTSNLEQIVDELRQMEQDAYAQVFGEENIVASPTQMEQAVDTSFYVSQIQKAPATILGETLTSGGDMTLPELSEVAVSAGTQFSQMNESYEAVGTQVRGDLGDKITKAFQNVDDILEDLEMPVTAANQRAVRILAYNQMEINGDSIAKIKDYDTKINNTLKALKPEVVAQMVKRDINPLELSMDELREAVAEISDEVETTDVSYAKYIWKMDKQSQITPHEKKSMIGIYRLLDKVDKSDGAVIGALVKENRNISLGSLLSEVRNNQAKGLDVSVDDDFGGLEELVTSKESITEQIEAGYASHLVKELKKNLSPDTLIKAKDYGLNLGLEELVEQCDEMGETEESSYYEMKTQAMKDTLANAKDAIEFLQQLEMPDSLENIEMAKQFIKQGGNVAGPVLTKEERKRLQESFDDPVKLEKEYEEMDETKTQAIAKEQEQTTDYETLSNLVQMNRSVHFYHSLRQRNMYELQVDTNQGTARVNVTLLQGEDMAGTAQISMENEDMGKLLATFSISDEKVTGFITGERKETKAFGEEFVENLKGNLKEQGLDVGNITYATGTRNDKVGSTTEVTTKTLYQVAKVFIQTVARKDDEYAD